MSRISASRAANSSGRRRTSKKTSTRISIAQLPRSFIGHDEPVRADTLLPANQLGESRRGTG